MEIMHIIFGIMCRKRNVQCKGEPIAGIEGLLESCLCASPTIAMEE